MQPRLPMKSPEEAWEVLSGITPPRRREILPRAMARDRVLATGVRARVDVPSFDVSAMDGYALAGDGAEGAPIPVVATIAAGAAPGLVLASGCAARIMTGAPVPQGADRVVPVELTDGGEHAVMVRGAAQLGAHIRRRGEVVRVDEPLLGVGTRLSPAGLAWLASHGVAEVEVYAAPRIAIATTGDEVVAPERVPGPGQLRDSHSDFLLASLDSLGVEAHHLGILPDRREAIELAVAEGLSRDILVLCGGVSAGAFDYVEPALLSNGCEILVDAVSVQPGKPLVIARGPQGQVVFGLPGNPASVLVSFTLFVRPLLEQLLGRRSGFWQAHLRARLQGEAPRALASRDRFVPVLLEPGGDGLLAVPIEAKGSHDLGAFARADGILRIRRDQRPQPGETVEVLRW